MDLGIDCVLLSGRCNLLWPGACICLFEFWCAILLAGGNNLISLFYLFIYFSSSSSLFLYIFLNGWIKTIIIIINDKMGSITLWSFKPVVLSPVLYLKCKPSYISKYQLLNVKRLRDSAILFIYYFNIFFLGIGWDTRPKFQKC